MLLNVQSDLQKDLSLFDKASFRAVRLFMKVHRVKNRNRFELLFFEGSDVPAVVATGDGGWTTRPYRPAVLDPRIGGRGLKRVLIREIGNSNN